MQRLGDIKVHRNIDRFARRGVNGRYLAMFDAMNKDRISGFYTACRSKAGMKKMRRAAEMPAFCPADTNKENDYTCKYGYAYLKIGIRFCARQVVSY